MKKLLLFSAIVSAVCSSGNIYTKTFNHVKPSGGSVNQEFGASLSFVGGNILYVGSPHFGDSVSSIKPGAIYRCPVNPNQLTTQLCGDVKSFANNGSMGISMKLSTVTRDLLVCGNQFVVKCPSDNIEQMLVGSCYAHNIINNNNRKLYTPCPEICGVRVIKADIIFVLDESGSIYPPTNFQLELEWVVNVLRQFRENINAGRVRVGVIFFNGINRVAIPLKLNSFTNLKTMILASEQKEGRTNIGSAMFKALELFQSNGRADVAKIMIVLTDGVSSQAHRVAVASNNAKKNNITTMSVGVGNGVDEYTLETIADNKRNRKFTVTDFSKLSLITAGLQNVIQSTATVTLEGQSTNSTNVLTQCQAGSSLDIGGSSVFVGAFGSYDRSGSMITYPDSANSVDYSRYVNQGNLEALIRPNLLKDFRDSYFGYSTTTGRFENTATLLLASGVPRYKLKGAVLIYNPIANFSNSNAHLLLHPTNNITWQLGGYFGYTVCSADLNKDNLDELLVSAPLYAEGTSAHDQGRVFVFWSNSANPAINRWMTPSYFPTILKGSSAVGSRFGSSVVAVGDLDQNGFIDIAIGAPHEEDVSGSSGVVYIYYSDRSGLSENKKQRIVGRNLVQSLRGFGGNIMSHSTEGGDLDRNGYPEVVAAAPRSGDVVVLYTRPVVVVTADVAITPSVIRVMDCIRRSNQTCVNLDVTLSARMTKENAKIGNNFVFDIRIDLDSLVMKQKRLLFLNEGSSVKMLKETLSKNPRRLSYNIALDVSSFTNLAHSDSLKTNPRIAVSWSLNQTGTNAANSPVLDFSSRTKIKDLPFNVSCSLANGACLHDLVATAKFSISQSVKPYVVGHQAGILFVNVSVVNRGPDNAILMRLDMTTPMLQLSKINGSCVDRISSKPGMSILVFRTSSVALLNAFTFPNRKCNFVLSYPLEELSKSGSASALSIKGYLYSGINATRWSDNNKENNQFSFRRKLLYTATLVKSRVASPSSVFYNRTTNETKVGSIADPILGGDQTDVNHFYKIYNTGPHGVAKMSMRFTWPAWLSSAMRSPLLYLYSFSCEPSGVCQCNVGNVINPLGLSETEKKINNIPLIFPSPSKVKLKADTTCSDVFCQSIMCSVTKLRPFQEVSIRASFKVWLPSLSQPRLSTTFFSKLVADTSASPIKQTDGGIFTIKASLAVSAYVAPTPPSVAKQVNIGIIIAAILGGLLILALGIIVMWKLGFFESKYAQMRKDAMQDDAAPSDGNAVDANDKNQIVK